MNINYFITIMVVVVIGSFTNIGKGNTKVLMNHVSTINISLGLFIVIPSPRKRS